MRLVLVLLLASCASAQVTWRMMPGDDPRWSSPAFDDSAWQTVPPPLYTPPEAPHTSGMQWYRAEFPIALAWKGQNLALGMPPFQDAFEVFIEGVKVGQFGSWGPKPVFYPPRHLSFVVPADKVSGPVAHVALRRWCWSARASATIMVTNSIGLVHRPTFGLAETVEAREELHALQVLESNGFNLFMNFLMFACGVLCFGISRHQRERSEYLWLAIFLILRGAPGLLAIPAGISFTMPQLSAYPIFLQLCSISSLLPLFWCLARLSVRFGFALRLFGVALAIMDVAVIAFMVAGWPLQIQLLPIRLWLQGAGALMGFAAAIIGVPKKRWDSMLLSIGLVIATALVTWRIPIVQFLTGDPVRRRISWGLLQIDVSDIGSLILTAIVLAVVWMRYQREQKRQAALQTELAAAREVQELLLGKSAPVTPGFAVEAVYRPAQEVGGDFYQILPAADGSLLVVIGDVSGKGLKAAMLVSALMGSLRIQPSRRPAEVLRLLNLSLTGQTRGGFVTCCCALFHSDGRVDIASAGHLHPYLKGKEIEIETGLPLGISPDSTYNEATLRMSDGAFTLLSDGVVEARSSKGELLGFERTAALTAKTASEVADAAQSFGQDDDITVLTIERIAKAACAA